MSFFFLNTMIKGRKCQRNVTLAPFTIIKKKSTGNLLRRYLKINFSLLLVERNKITRNYILSLKFKSFRTCF